MSRTGRTAIAALLAIVCCAPAARAQEGSTRAYRGLFTGAGQDPSGDAPFDLVFTMAETYDDNVRAELGTLDPLASDTGGYYSMLLTSTDFQWRGRRVQVAGTGLSNLRYYDSVREVRAGSQALGLGVSTQLGERTTFSVGPMASYSPAYLYALFPTAAPEGAMPALNAAPDYVTGRSESLTYGSTATLTRSFSRRNTLSVSGQWERTSFTHQVADRGDMTTYGVVGRFSRNVTRNSVTKIGYRYRRGTFGLGARDQSAEHGLDIGVDYSPPLSATRRFVVGVSLGTTLLATPVAAENAQLPANLYRLTGEASARYDFGRTWQARGVYRRGLEYIPGLVQPVYTGGFTSGAEGLLARRLELALSAGYATGASALTATSFTFDTYTGSARLRYGLSRKWAAVVEYLYYYYEFRGTLQLGPGLPPGVERNTVRAGLTLWLRARGR